MIFESKDKSHKILFPLIGLYLLLIGPFIYVLPYLDGAIDFAKASAVANAGISGLFFSWPSVHPPLKPVLLGMLFRLFGTQEILQSLLGIGIGVMGIIGMYKTVSLLASRRTALWASALLTLHPLYLAVSQSALIDFLLAVWAIWTVWAIRKRNWAWSCIFLILAVMTKETGLVLVGCVICALSGVAIAKKQSYYGNFLYDVISVGLPVGIFLSWTSYLKGQGIGAWSDWIFASTAGKGAFYTTFNNLVSGSWINSYTRQHWSNLFLLNFEWVYWIIAVFVGAPLFIRHWREKYSYENLATWLVIGSFTLSYVMFVLTFQTYTIPRYVLPVVILSLPIQAYGIDFLIERAGRTRIVWLCCFVLFCWFRLFFSLDPVSLALWGTDTVLGEKIYNTKVHLAGNDGLTYNLQYLKIARTRDHMIRMVEIHSTFLSAPACAWVFPDPNNEGKVLESLGFRTALFAMESCRFL